MKIHSGINEKSEFMEQLKKLIYNWNLSLDDNLTELQGHYLAMWELAQAALKEITGIEFHFTRTDSFYGICTEDEDFLIKVDKEARD